MEREGAKMEEQQRSYRIKRRPIQPEETLSPDYSFPTGVNDSLQHISSGRDVISWSDMFML